MRKTSNGAVKPITPLGQARQVEQAQVKPSKQFKKWRSVEQLLGYKGFTNDDHHYLVLAHDWGYAEICRIPGVGLTALPDNMLSQPTQEFTEFLQHYDPDWSFIATQFPATTAQQQLSLNHDYLKVEQALVNCHDNQQRQMLTTQLRYINESLQIATAVEKTLKSQEYLALIFGDTPAELTERVATLFQRQGHYLRFELLGLDRKIKFLYSLNNMNDKKI
ncbi:hypothetical protein GPK32_00620 (plasmid) [Lactiplantibacillus plantarum]|uniref:hypothetical protein n=1 Tax=Lactiplantibacillus plantarum TaxID=1590 RepID=UPI0012FA2476|nr:hypothetical protein [Lactiplantibacillus plantarum]QGX67537.1 hypothetical protein GPK32_00620 [Lactiplantibacillus plantarum]